MTEQQNKTTPMIMYIPYINDSFTIKEIVDVFEVKYKIGVIEHIEGVPKVNQKDGHGYFSYFIYMREWNVDTDNANYILSNMYDGIQTRIRYNDSTRYWVICPNTSEVTSLPIPKQMDVSLYLHTDVSPQTIFTVLEALEWGKINSIQFIKDEPDKNKYENQTVWKGLKKEVWQEKVNSSYNTIHIHFDYWYHTKSAYEFQEEMSKNKSVDIPIDNSTKWTFYEITPMLKGGNPFIFYPNQIPQKTVSINIDGSSYVDCDRYMRFYDENGIEEYE